MGEPSAPAAELMREATHEELAEYCQTADCRGPLTISVIRDDGTRFESFYDLWTPVVDEDGIVNILPGDTIDLMADISGDRLVNIRLSPSGPQPVNGLEFVFWQDTSLSQGSDMLLKVHSTLDRPVKFDLHMMTFDSGSLIYTSSCPVHPGVAVFEHWPHAIFQLFATDFRLLEDSAANTCQ